MKIVFFKPTTVIGHIICFISRGQYSHCGLLLDDNSFIEALPFTKVRHISQLDAKRYNVKITKAFQVNTTPEERKSMTDFLMLQIGKSYDYWSIFGIIWNGSDAGRKMYKKWFCSEIVFAAFQKVNINLLEDIPAWKTTPVLLSYSDKLI
jgi:uncharacterized protein YycO